jgi:hypothetical protein
MMSCALAAGLATAAFAVQVHVAFDPTISSTAIRRIVKEEAAAIWKPYGVELVFSEDGDVTDPAPGLPRIDVTVERSARRAGESQPVLARATIAPGRLVPDAIRISFDAVDVVIEDHYGDHPGLHDFTIATALGRVLAHELGHVLLGPPGYHDPIGLMRATFPADDLVRTERSRFQLTGLSIARLHERIGTWADGATDAR